MQACAMDTSLYHMYGSCSAATVFVREQRLTPSSVSRDLAIRCLQFE